MAWIALIVAGLMEIVWALAIKQSQGFTKMWPSMTVLAALPISMFLLTYALKSLPVGTAYTVWVGIGAAGVAAVGMFVLGESVSIAKFLFLTLILGGVVGLRVLENSSEHPSVGSEASVASTKS